MKIDSLDNQHRFKLDHEVGIIVLMLWLIIPFVIGHTRFSGADL